MAGVGSEWVYDKALSSRLRSRIKGTVVLTTQLRFNILFPAVGYDEVSETNLRSHSVHAAKHAQENRPVPVRRKRSIGKNPLVVLIDPDNGGSFGQSCRALL